MQDEQRNTIAVSDEVFRRVYDSPAALPGLHRWLTCDKDVREIENVTCVQCGTAFENLRSFKCHNWAYAMPAILEIIEQGERERLAGEFDIR